MTRKAPTTCVSFEFDRWSRTVLTREAGGAPVPVLQAWGAYAIGGLDSGDMLPATGLACVDIAFAEGAEGESIDIRPLNAGSTYLECFATYPKHLFDWFADMLRQAEATDNVLHLSMFAPVPDGLAALERDVAVRESLFQGNFQRTRLSCGRAFVQSMPKEAAV